MQGEASTQIAHPFAKAENKTLLLFVNVIQEKYDSTSIIRVSCKNKFMLSCVRVQVTSIRCYFPGSM
jgi:hypothetical protein